MKYGELTLGQVEAVVNKLGGMEGVRRLLSGELIVKAVEEPVLRVWRTIQLGTGLKTAEDFSCALNGGGFRVSDWAKDILGKTAFTVATEETQADLVRVRVSELGFKRGATREQIYERAKELGLELCPAEVGPQLRLQYKDQPNGEWVLVGMEPILDSDGDLHVFCVGRDDSERWLRSYWSSPDSFWYPGPLWVFVRPRK